MQLRSYIHIFRIHIIMQTAFSYLKMRKSEYQATFSDERLEQSLYLADRDYFPDYNQWYVCNVTLPHKKTVCYLFYFDFKNSIIKYSLNYLNIHFNCINDTSLFVNNYR